MRSHATLGALALLCLAAACTEQQDLPGVAAETDAGDMPDTPDEAGADPTPEPEPLPRSCGSDADCDDGLGCTTDRCLEMGTCDWTLGEGQCLIGRVCHEGGEPDPRQSCRVCDPAAPFVWSPKPEGTGCDDGDACTEGEVCSQGACGAGEAVVCQDDNPCTTDACDSARGCLFAAGNEGVACDDGEACTEGDVCSGGACAGRALDCDDEDPCTDDACGEGGACVHVNNTAPCEDGSACTQGDVCAEGVCVGGPPPNCEDGNICTIDGCDTLAGCFHLPTENPCCIGLNSICDDGDPCTSDLCDPQSGDCLYEFNTATCDDASACTRADTCSEGDCVGAAVVCDDGNGCTEDRCSDTLGCVAVPQSDLPCDDGVVCTVEDVCVQGVCLGDDAGCVCEPDFGQSAAKFTRVAIGAPGEGLDLDGDGMPNNQLGVVGSLVNGPLQEGVDAGSLVLLLDFIDFQRNPFVLAAYDGGLAESNPDCDLQQAVCDYVAGDGLFDPDTCAPLVSLPATLDGGALVAGGPGTVFPFRIPFGEGALALTLYEVRLVADVVIEEGQVTSITGTLGGAVRRGELLAALRQLPEGALPFPVDAIAPLLDRLVMDDIDTTDDGVDMADAASISLAFDGIRARIVGMAR